jgi:RNA polymerase sigma factor (sigma-70 family)
MPRDFEQAYNEHVGRIYGYFAYRVSSRADAQDLTQLTFERALRAWRRYDERRAPLMSWLFTIARNALIDHRRRDRSSAHASLSHGDVSEGELPSRPGPEEERLGPSPELVAGLRRLRSRDREVLALRFGADLPVAEIAEVLGLSVANVQQILSRSLRKLRQRLEGDASGERRASRAAGTGAARTRAVRRR